MRKIFGTLLVGAALMAPVMALAAPQVQVEVNPHRYYDRDHKDWHNWDDHEDRAYRAWTVEQNRNQVEWARLHSRDQRAYWRWRHEHPNAGVQVEVR